MSQVLSIILAGGKGDRLSPLTRDRAKPAVPFAGIYRIIDFALSNCVNSGLRQMFVLTQYKSMSLDRHLRQAWNSFPREWGEFIDVLPPQQRIGEHWYRGTADAVFQNLEAIRRTNADHVLILCGDHVYQMDYRELLNQHEASGADVTVACIPVPLDDASNFGIMQVGQDWRITDFHEKPAHPKPMPDASDYCLASMGIYVFDTAFLLERLRRDAEDSRSAHDFGKSIIPSLIRSHDVRAFPFHDSTGNSAYWRDVGTLDAYYQANMDLLEEQPRLDLYDPQWRFHTYLPPWPPPRVGVHTNGHDGSNGHSIRNALIAPGAMLSDADVENSVLSPNVRLGSGTMVWDSILMDGVTVGRNARIRRAIIDKDVFVPDEAMIGFDQQLDRARGFTITESGVVVIPKGTNVGRMPRPRTTEIRVVPGRSSNNDGQMSSVEVGSSSSQKSSAVRGNER